MNGNKIENNIKKDITFKDLFDLKEIQSLQDKIAGSYGLAAIITDPTGYPITRESNFTRLCSDIIRKTPEGYKRCVASDALIGRSMNKGPNIHKCYCCGLWDSGASIYAGDKHVANLLFGQANDGSVTDKDIRKFAEEIGADPD
jgi:ligand-binding sensor protein